MSKFRRRLMGLAALRQSKADDFVRVEYIENTSTAYINTGVNVLNSKYFDIDISFSVLNRNNYIIGQRKKNDTITSPANTMDGILVNTSNNFETGVAMTDANNSDYIVEVDKRYRISGDYKNVTVTYTEVDEETSEETQQSFTITNDGVYTNNHNKILYLFNINQPKFNTANAMYGKMYGCKLYNGTVLLRDFIPMYQISTDTYGLWDRVEGKFYTSPNGVKFIGGHQIIYDAEIEYLQSTGSQYIKTGIIPTSEFSFEITADILGNYEWNPIGVWHYWLKDMFGVDLKFSKSGSIINCWGNTFTEEKVRPINTWLKISQKNGEQIISRLSDGYIYLNSTLKNTFNCSTDIYIFALNLNNHATYRNNGRISSVIIRNNNKTLLDLIPVRVGNVGYMYDKVSNKLFGNDGSGSFILGQDTVVYDKI